MSREAYRVVAPFTQGARDIYGLLPRVRSDAFSDQVAQVVEAKGELERQKRDSRRSLLSRALLNTALGTGVGAALGAMKSIPITRDVWNPNVAATTAALSGATALAFTLARHALSPRLTSEAQETIDQADPAVRYVAGHASTREKAKDWERAQWVPYMAGEGGAILGGLGALGGAWALGKPNSLTTGLTGAGIGAAAGLGLGYLYRKRKQKQFLEHVENELAMSQSPKAQEAAVQAEVEREPMFKAAETDAERKKRLLGYTALGLGAASAVGSLSLIRPGDVKPLTDFSETAKSWQRAVEDPRVMARQYSDLGAKAIGSSSLSLSKAIEVYRKSPISPMPWGGAASGRHYSEFEKGPVFAYLQQAAEGADETDTSEISKTIRAYTKAVGQTANNYLASGKLSYPEWLLHPSINDRGLKSGDKTVLEHVRAYGKSPSDIPDGGTDRFEGSLRSIFDEIRETIPGRPAAGPKQMASGLIDSFENKDVLPRLTKAMADTSQHLFGQQDITKLTQEQQSAVLKESDNFLKQTDPKTWAAKQLYDAGIGLTRYPAGDLYPKYIDNTLAARNVALYGGLAVAALGGGVLLHQWLNRKKEDKKPSNIVQFPQDRLEKAAMTLIKEALVTGGGWPVVSTNAPLLNGNGGPPERYSSGKYGVRRVYDAGLGAIEVWKTTSKPQLEKRTQTEKLAEDDPNALGEELDDVALGMARVFEEQHGSKVVSSPPPSTGSSEKAAPSSATASEGAPSTKVAAEDRSGLPYRKRVEVYAMKDGKVYGGVYKDGGFGVFGGGFDDDDVVTAAEREFAEETGLVAKNIRILPVEPVKIDWNPPYKSEKQAERAKQFRGAQTFFVVADLDDSSPVAKADGDDGKSLLRWPRLYAVAEAIELCGKAESDSEGVKKINNARMQALEKLDLKKTADAAQFLPRKEVLVFTPDGKIAVRRGTNRRFDLPSDVEGKPVPYEQPVQLLPEGGVPEKGVHGYQVALHSAEGALPEGFEGVDPQDVLKDLYAALGKPINRQFQSLDRARARALLRLVKRRTPPPAPVAL